MKILLIDNGTRLLSELQDLIPGAEITVEHGRLSALDTSHFNLIVLSGSSTSSVIWNHAEFLDEIHLVCRTDTPIVGICFGAELIAHAFDGKLEPLDRPHHGIREITIQNNDFSPQRSLKVYEHHRWIVKSLPQDFEVLATSPEGIEAFRHRLLPLYGLQFHPEKCGEETETRAIFLRIVKLLTTT